MTRKTVFKIIKYLNCSITLSYIIFIMMNIEFFRSISIYEIALISSIPVILINTLYIFYIIGNKKLK
jgi:hypothetical protein